MPPKSPASTGNALRLLSAAVLIAAAAPANAAILWKDNTLDNLNLVTSWGTAEAGTPDPAAIAAADALRFGGSGQGASNTYNLGGSLSVGGIRLDNATGTLNYNVTINGSAGQVLTLNGASSGDIGYATGGIVLNSATGGTLTINADIALGAAQQWVTSRALTVNGAINLGASRTLAFNVAGAGNVMTLAGVISGTGTSGLNKSAGPGRLEISNAANTFSGQVSLVGGTTRVSLLTDSGINSSLGTGSSSSSIIMNGSVLETVGASNMTTNRVIDMRASAVINNTGAGTLTLTANVIQGGTASARTFTLGGSNTGNNIFQGTLSNSGTGVNITTLQKSGVGTWVLTGASTATGATIISQGTLRLSGSATLPGVAGLTTDVGNIYFASGNTGGLLEFETSAQLGAAGQVRFRNTGGGAGNGGMLRFIGTTDQIVSKDIQSDSTIGVRLSSESSTAKVTFNGSFATIVGGTRPVYLEGSSTTLNEITSAIGTGINGLTKRGTGTWVLSGNSNYTAATTVSGGTLILGNANALGTTAAGTTISSGAVLNLSGQTIGAEALNLSGTGISSGGVLINSSGSAASISGVLTLGSASTIGSGDITLGGSVAGAFGLTKSGTGTLTLNVTSNAASSVTLSGGTLVAGSATALGAGSVSVSNGTLNLNNQAANNAIALSGGSVINAASYTGMLTASANTALNGSFGGTFVTGGTITTSTGLTFTDVLKGTGTIAGNVTVDGATHAPGTSPGVQTIDGDLTYSGGASLVEWELISNTANIAQVGTAFDGIIVNGNLDLSVGVALTLIFDADGSTVNWNDAFWAANRSWTIYDVSGSTTGFSNLSLTDALASPIDGLVSVNTSLDSNSLGLSTARSDAAFYLQNDGADIRLYYRAVPEPSTYGLILGALALAGAAIRRRKQISK